MTSDASYVRDLLDRAFDDLANPECPLSVALGKTIRIARIRKDVDSLIWLTMESRGTGDKQARDRSIAEFQPHFPSYEDLRVRWAEEVESYISVRTLADPGQEDVVAGMSVPEIEAQLRTLCEFLDRPIDANLTHAEQIVIEKARLEAQFNAGRLRRVLARIRHRLEEYLSTVETRLVLDDGVTTIFEEHRRFVDGELQRDAPDALEQLAAAYKRRNEESVEARSQALMSCRRALKTVADRVYPATGESVLGADGKHHEMTDTNYRSRLLQFVSEQGDGATDADLLASQVDELSGKLERLISLASKGVHDKVSATEVNHCVIQTYLTIGDVLQVRTTRVTPAP
jgi:hypothetical protein